MAEKALFINGIFENVLEEIIFSQKRYIEKIFYLQPYSKDKIRLLADDSPDENNTVTLYFSTSNNLKDVVYTADIIKWENKDEIDQDRLSYLNQFIRKYQPNEKELYLSKNGKKCINLISVGNVRKLISPISVSNLIKISDNTPLSTNRTRSGGWSVVYKIDIDPIMYFDDIETVAFQVQQVEFEKEFALAKSDTHEARQKRLESYDSIPQKVKVLSNSYIRNPDVVAEVLFRAEGICERCQKEAPFIRSKGNTPYLEVHHIIPIAEGGLDTLTNSLALCPNCHRELHFGINR